LLFDAALPIICSMNIKIMLSAFAILIVMQAPASAAQAISAGARYHMRHSEYAELPYDDGDLSYLLGYEYHENNAFWQLLVGYAPDITTGDEDGTGAKSVVTPQLNLFFADGNWLGGVGILASYIDTEDSESSDWTDVYWQLMLGLQLPLPVLDVELMAYYPFEKWSTLSEFEAGDIEFGVQIKFKF